MATAATQQSAPMSWLIIAIYAPVIIGSLSLAIWCYRHYDDD